MADPWQPQPLTDPEQFFKNMLNPDEAERVRAYKYAKDFLYGEAIRYGYLNDPASAPTLRQLFDYFIEKGMPAAHRMDVLRHVIPTVESNNSVSVGALFPFICQDPDRGVASTAALEYVSLGPLIDNDPMSRPKELIELIKAREPQNRGAVFGALLALGDPRLCRLLWPIKDQLSYEEANEAAQCTSGFLGAATIDFVLDWMEGLEGTGEDALFGSLVSHLILQRRHMIKPFVATGERPFPVTSATPEEAHAMAKWIPFEDYLDRVAPRLIALATEEPEPRCLPEVLRAWGIAAPILNN